MLQLRQGKILTIQIGRVPSDLEQRYQVMVSRILPAILSDHLVTTRDFYINLFAFTVAFESDFYLELASPENPSAQLGVWRRDHDLVPQEFRRLPAGMVLSFSVKDVDSVHSEAKRHGLKIVQPVRNEGYGQRHFMTVDPNGLLLDVTSPIPMSEDFIAQHMTTLRPGHQGYK
jgi:predicted enzyme related to lactoylglutathione lyase